MMTGWAERQVRNLVYVGITRARHRLFIPYVTETEIISASSAVASKSLPPDSLHSSLRLPEALIVYVKAVFSILFLVGPTVVLVRVFRQVFSAKNGEKTAQN